ncbi:MAG: four helix bundle protein [Phycisphaeraceae bacterium]
MEQFDHEKLKVYQQSLVFVGWTDELVQELNGRHRSARDQLIRCSQSIPLNIAEGNGKRSGAEKRRYFEIARGSALEAAAALDVLVVTNARNRTQVTAGKEMLLPIVKMLIRLVPPDGNGGRGR